MGSDGRNREQVVQRSLLKAPDLWRNRLTFRGAGSMLTLEMIFISLATLKTIRRNQLPNWFLNFERITFKEASLSLRVCQTSGGVLRQIRGLI